MAKAAETRTGDAGTREEVRRRYAELARRSTSGCACGDDPRRSGYDDGQLAGAPEGAALFSLGCGNPLIVAELKEGERVLDLGSGGGLDVILSAQRVGAGGRAYGLDMTDEMLELSRRNAAAAGVENAVFLKGYMEDVPLPDGSVDVVISNCVINLSPDKTQVFHELARVLRSGGRIGIADVVADDRLTPGERAERGSFAGCIAGALSFSEYRAGLEQAGFEEVEIRPTREVADGIHDAIIRGHKPQRG